MAAVHEVLGQAVLELAEQELAEQELVGQGLGPVEELLGHKHQDPLSMDLRNRNQTHHCHIRFHCRHVFLIKMI